MEYCNASIVVVGAMNPAIYSPAWLRRLRIVDEDEIAPAENEFKGQLFASASIAQLRCRNFVLQAESDKLTLQVLAAAHLDLLKQTASRIFSHLLHTPVAAVGINLHARLAFDEDIAAQKLRSLFVHDAERIDRSFPEGWDVSAQITSRTAAPRVQFRCTREKREMPPRVALRVESNFHYEYEQMITGEAVPRLLDERFPRDRGTFERLVRELVES